MLNPVERNHYLEVFTEPAVLAASFLDEEGRPLAEQNASRALREGIEFKTKACSYPGSRNGKQINVPALRAMRHQWRMVLDEIDRYRTAYIVRAGRSHLTLYDVWRLARVITTLPVYLTRRARQPVSPRNIPVLVALMYKVGQGVHMVAEHMLLRSDVSSRVVQPEELEAFAENEGMYLSLDGKRACAGPPHLIRHLLALFVRGATTRRSRRSARSGITDEHRRQLEYSDQVNCVHVDRMLFEAQARMATAKLVEEIGSITSPAAVDELVAVVARTAHRFGRFCGASLGELDTVTRRLWALPGIAPMPSPMSGDAREREVNELLTSLRSGEGDVPEEVLRLCYKHLTRYSHLERQWLRRLEKGQAAVCSALNREAPRARLASDDFCGQGFTPRDAVSGWLGVELHDGPEPASLHLYARGH